MQGTEFGNEHEHVAIALNSLFEVYTALGKIELGEQVALEAYEIRKSSPDKLRLSLSLISLGEVTLFQENYRLSKSYYMQALTIRKQELEKDHRDLVRIRMWLGILNNRIGKLARAELLLRKAVDFGISGIGENDPDTIDALLTLAIFYFSHQKTDIARMMFTRIITACDSVTYPNLRVTHAKETCLNYIDQVTGIEFRKLTTLIKRSGLYQQLAGIEHLHIQGVDT